MASGVVGRIGLPVCVMAPASKVSVFIRLIACILTPGQNQAALFDSNTETGSLTGRKSSCFGTIAGCVPVAGESAETGKTLCEYYYNLNGFSAIFRKVGKFWNKNPSDGA
ncbi:hypothetical protein HED49_11105 [Ochrobactrum daejeonense]|nr:hypothetical protein [Brucella daejeonensis]